MAAAAKQETRYVKWDKASKGFVPDKAPKKGEEDDAPIPLQDAGEVAPRVAREKTSRPGRPSKPKPVIIAE